MNTTSPAASGSKAPPEIVRLRSAAAVRERCNMVACWVADGRSRYFTVDESRLDAVADYVAEVTRESYPDLNIPYHSRWRHFCAGGIDRWKELTDSARVHPLERARMAVDLVTVSVLLDAGAGDSWRYRGARSGNDVTRSQALARSEGLAVASLDMFRAGAFSSDSNRMQRVDDAALARIDAATLARHFQVDAGNPLIGLEARSNLLRGLGEAMSERPDLFGCKPARPGNLIDHLVNASRSGGISAAGVLATLLDALAPIWPSALMLNGIPVGDAGQHSAVRTHDGTDGIVPFHKLSQWLTYSLIEPLAWAGIEVERINELTALPEYRNGGLLVDLGAIGLRPGIEARAPHAVQSELVVEWRALTVALMDRLLDDVRGKLGLSSSFSLPQMLQGGTWSAGRKIARALRPPDGPSPILVAADGTVF
jgi:Protein of unknown function (DUF1688)